MTIVFSPKDTVITLNYDNAEKEYLRWINSTNRYEEIGLLCSSANNGYANTQAIQAMRYRYGLYNTAIDNIQAYFWLKLADFGGQHNLQEVMQQGPLGETIEYSCHRNRFEYFIELI